MHRPDKKWFWLVPTVLACSLVVPGVILHFLMPPLLNLSTDASIRQSGADRQIVDAFHHSPAAMQLLGDSLQTGWPFKGDIREHGSAGRLIFNLPVSGSRNKGLLYGTATKQKNQWHIDQMAIRLEGQADWQDLGSGATSAEPPAAAPPITAH